MNFYTVSLLVLTQHFLTTLANNVTSERKTLAKVLTSFLKVPWIDLSSSWTDVVSSTCRNDIVTLFESADNGEMWALQMLDATSKVPVGILTGNVWDLGMFDECIGVKSHEDPANIQGQHCMVSLSIPTKFFGDVSRMMRIQKLVWYNPSADVDLSLSMSVCVPSSCGIQDINGLVNASIRAMPELGAFEVDVAKVACSSLEPRSQFTLGSILTLSFFTMVAFLLLLCTACDFVLRSGSHDGPTVLKTAAKFSLYTNAIKLSSTVSKSETMLAVNGIRVLSVFLVVAFHRSFCVLLEPTINVSYTYELMHSRLSALIFTAPFVVDTSFVLSAFFITYSFLEALRSGKKYNILTTCLHRYLRLTPCVAVVLLFVIFVIPYLGSGPIWEKVSDATVTNCQKNWWTNLLYVQNVVNVDEICLLHTWYLAVDMQLFWLSPIILYPLFHRPKVGLGILSMFLIASFLAPAVQLWIHRWSAIIGLHKRSSVLWSEFLKSYPATYNRAFPYLLGILLGYDVSYNKRQISRIQVAINWSLTGLFVIFCGWTANHIQPVVVVYDVVWEMVYVSVARLGWGFAMAWVIYACTQGYGGPITKFLSLPMFVPLSRLSYNIYLVHFVLQVLTTATKRTADYMEPFRVICTILSDLVISTLIASILYLLVESPMTVWTTLWLPGRFSAPTIKHDSTTKQAKFFAGVEKYLDFSRDRVGPDFVIESITSKLDFWQRICDDLNTLSEGTPKSPTEWSKTWQDWQLKSSEENGICEAQNRSKIVQIEQSQPQIGVELRKELMVFLAAVNYGLTDSTDSMESLIKKNKISDSVDQSQQHVNSIPLLIPNSNLFRDTKR